ncbi:citrate transporter, partial [Enterococcus faecalis]|nr:citrate transporter [Enterococcus faecalis]
LITTGHLKGGFVEASRKIAKYGSDGAISVAPMMAFLLAIATYNAAAAYVAPYLGALLSPVIPATTLGLAIVFGVFGVLGHFRGPMNLVGSGL